MHTRDTTFKTNYMQNDSGDSHDDNDENRINFENDPLIQQEANINDNFDNFLLCQKYGQPNIEKAILLLILIILFAVAILYYYWNYFKLYYIRLLLVSSSVDLLLLLFFCALRIKFNSNEWISSFPIQFYNFMDYVLIINFLLKLVIFILYFFFKITLSSIFLFSGKFLLELYLLLSCVKLIIFCPGYKSCLGIFEIAVGWIQFMLFCCESQEEKGFNRLSDDSSDYNNINNDQDEE